MLGQVKGTTNRQKVSAGGRKVSGAGAGGWSHSDVSVLQSAHTKWLIQWILCHVYFTVIF